MNDSSIAELVMALKESSKTTVLSGAGISTESGIPDFRSPGGLYSQFDPIEYLSVWALEDTPPKFWKAFNEIFGSVGDFQPNIGHRILSQMQQSNLLQCTITQNIDGLHQRAGSSNVIEIHGHLRTVRCTGCGDRVPLIEALAQLKDQSAPHCVICQHPLRPDVILFGDALERFEQATQEVRTSDLLLVIGSSLSVSPVNMLAYDAKTLAIINNEPTEMDHLSKITVHGAAGETLCEIARQLDLDLED